MPAFSAQLIKWVHKQPIRKNRSFFIAQNLRLPTHTHDMSHTYQNDQNSTIVLSALPEELHHSSRCILYAGKHWPHNANFPSLHPALLD